MHSDDVRIMTVSDSTFFRNGHLRLSAAELDAYEGFPWVFAGGALSAAGYVPVQLSVLRCEFDANAAEGGGGIAVTQWGYVRGNVAIADSNFTANEVGMPSCALLCLLAAPCRLFSIRILFRIQPRVACVVVLGF